MHYRKLGHSGLSVSEIAFGTWLTFANATDIDTARLNIKAALAAGINFFDTADEYAKGGAEQVLGETLADVPRKDVVVATKLFFPMSEAINDRGLSRKHIAEAVDASLDRLGMDYIDVYYCHRFDPATPLDETVRAMDDLVRAGRILYWGVSQWTAPQISEMMKVVREMRAARPIANQPLYNMVSRGIEAEIMPACAKEGLGIVAYSPLAQGLLTGKYTSMSDVPADSRAADNRQNFFIKRSFLNEANIAKAQKMAAVATRLGIAPGLLALAWCLRRAEVSSVIIGASRPQQVHDNAAAAGIKLDESVQKELEEILA